MEYQEYLDKYVSYDKILIRRCWAALIDYCVFYILLLLYGYFFGNVKEWYFYSYDSYSFNIELGLALPTIWFLYFPLLEAIFGYTPGKGLFDLKVIQENKKDLFISVTIRRHLADIIDFFVLFGIGAILLVKFTDEHKRIGDFWANSKVILEEDPAP